MNEMLEYSCKNGDYIGIFKSILNGANNFNHGLHGACEGNNIKCVYIMILMSYLHCRYISYSTGLEGACRGGHMKMIEKMIDFENGDCVWDYGLQGACIGNQLEIAEYMVSKGAKNYHNGLYYAELYGHVKLVDYMKKLLK